jgi:hypothetical protein
MSQGQLAASEMDVSNLRGKFAEQLDAFQVELQMSQGQLAASEMDLSNLRDEIQQELADLRMAAQAQIEAARATCSTFKLEVQRDIQTTSDTTALQLKARLDMLSDHLLLEQTKKVNLSCLKEEIQKELAHFQVASQAQSEATQNRNFELEQYIQTTNDNGALQSNCRLDQLSEQIVKHTKKVDGCTPQALKEVLGSLKYFSEISDRQEARIDKLVDEMRLMSPQVLRHGQSLRKIISEFVPKKLLPYEEPNN